MLNSSNREALDEENKLKPQMPFFGLTPGDHVDIIAPGFGCDPSVLEKVAAFLTAWGLIAHIPHDIFGEDFLFSNKTQNRLQQLLDALTNETSKAVWCLKGGYGSTRLLPQLLTHPPIVQRKQFIGFSDITALHIFLQQQWGWRTIHGPVARQVALETVSPASIHFLKAMLFQEETHFLLENIKPMNQAAAEVKSIKAPLIGGNLCLLAASLGTFWQVNPTGKILFIEDVKEPAYQIDRMLEHLSQAGVMQQAEAILLGDFYEDEESHVKSLVLRTLRAFAMRTEKPVLKMKDLGHGFENRALPLGIDATLTMGKGATLGFSI